MNKLSLEVADKAVFAVSQTIYSNTDIEMWFDWNSRLNDTKEFENCMWVVFSGERIGGCVINGDNLMYPFIVPPFADRPLFWQLLCKKLNSDYPQVCKINGVTVADEKVLQYIGYQTTRTRRVMCCPANNRSIYLPDGYSVLRIVDSSDFNQIGKVLYDSYLGGIDYEVFGTPEIDEVVFDAKRLFDIYKKNSYCVSIVHNVSKELAGVCLAGLNEEMPLGFAELAEISTLPQHRGRGIAEYMLNYVITQAKESSQAVKLCVTVGNSAEALYRKVGFFPVRALQI